MTGISLRYIKEFDIDPRQSVVRIDKFGPPHPLAGHAGSCAKVTTATVTGKTDAVCSCTQAGGDR